MTKNNSNNSNRDDFPAIKVGRQYWVAQDSLKQYLSSRKIIG